MRYFLFLFIGVFSLTITSCKQHKSADLRIAVAANMQFAMDELTTAFTKETGITCELIISSSGKLTAQLQEGAPYDVFLSADMSYPMTLHQAGLTIDTPKVYAKGGLVLWTATKDFQPSMELLTSERIERIAIANPKTAPYGRAAIASLRHYGVYNDVQHKLVYGESIAQVNQFVQSKAATVGFTTTAVVHTPTLQDNGNWTSVPIAAYKPIEQGYVIISGKKRQERKGQRFGAFLSSEKAHRILKSYGYLVPNL